MKRTKRTGGIQYERKQTCLFHVKHFKRVFAYGSVEIALGIFATVFLSGNTSFKRNSLARRNASLERSLGR